MKIIVRVSPPRSVSKEIRKHFGDLVTNDLIDNFDLDVASDRFSHYLELTRNETEGTWFNPWMEFTEEELDQCDYLQPVCRGPVFAESDADYKQTRKWLDAAPKKESNDGFKVSLLERVCVKERKLKSDVIAGVLQWTPDFILPTSIVSLFSQSQLDGFSVKEVFNRKAQLAYGDYHLLYADHFMPAANRVVFPPEGTSSEELSLHGCLCYEALDRKYLKDFNRTAEPWASNNFPLWVVSRRVREIYRKHKLKGWSFAPVLEEGSDLYKEHKLCWKRFVGAIQINQANHV